MKLIQARNYKELSKIASEIIIDEISHKPSIILGFATGKTPSGTYKNLVRNYKNKKVDFSKIKAFALDEYYPLKENGKRSYYYYLYNKFFNKINIKKDNIHLLDGTSKDVKKECTNFEKKIRKNPIDMQILGIGVNGHIGFNEPGSTANSKTRLVQLTPSTIKVNKYLDKGLTMGISTIMKSKKILLLASGKNKAKIIKNLMNSKPNKNLPASFLKNHKNLTIIIDKKAGSLL